MKSPLTSRISRSSLCFLQSLPCAGVPRDCTVFMARLGALLLDSGTPPASIYFFTFAVDKLNYSEGEIRRVLKQKQRGYSILGHPVPKG